MTPFEIKFESKSSHSEIQRFKHWGVFFKRPSLESEKLNSPGMSELLANMLDIIIVRVETIGCVLFHSSIFLLGGGLLKSLGIINRKDPNNVFKTVM